MKLRSIYHPFLVFLLSHSVVIEQIYKMICTNLLAFLGIYLMISFLNVYILVSSRPIPISFVCWLIEGLLTYLWHTTRGAKARVKRKDVVSE